jgi:RimJ/RimL family protein N-acetyltransferase
MPIPRLETERLFLRGWRADDLDALADLYSDEKVMRFIGGTLTRFDTWRALASMVGQWTLRGYGVWAVERKSDRAMVGRVGLIHPDGWPHVELGWTLAREFWGNGYATEAAQAALDYAFVKLSVEKMISLIDPDNTASQNVAERIGETRGHRHVQNAGKENFTVEIWSIARAQWSSKPSAR